MPALAKSLTGLLGFSVNPTTRPTVIELDDAARRRDVGAWNRVRVATASPRRWNSINVRRSKSVRLSALHARKNSSPATHPRLATRVPALPSSSGSKMVWTLGGTITVLDVGAHDFGEGVDVHEDLVDTGPVELVEPDVEQRPSVDHQHALRGVVGERSQAGFPDPPPSRKAFIRRPSARRRAPACGRSPGPGCLRDRPCLRARPHRPRPTRAGATPGLPIPSALRAPMSDTMWRVSPNRYSPVTLPGRSDPYWRLTTSANSRVVTGSPPRR